MHIITALALVIGLLAGVATYLCLGTPLGLQVWALFIGWGAFFHGGGKLDALKANSINHAWGAIVASLALMAVGHFGTSVPLISGIVTVSVIVMIMAAHLPQLGAIPAAVYGYASTAAFALLTKVAIGEAAPMFTAAGIVVASLIVGNVFGFVSEKIAGSIAKS